MIRVLTSSSVGERWGHSRWGCRRVSVTWNDAQGPLPRRVLLMLPVSQASAPKVKASPRAAKRR